MDKSTSKLNNLRSALRSSSSSSSSSQNICNKPVVLDGKLPETVDKCNKVLSEKNGGAIVAIKSEALNDEFKEYAETAMNELLGWYGYSNNNNNHNNNNNSSGSSNNSNNNNNELSKKIQNLNKLATSHSNDEESIMHKTDMAKRHETEPIGHANKDQEIARKLGNNSDTESPKSADLCDWCGKAVDDSSALTSNDAIFCSEMCFSQSRRANFKRNKTCDWCKHVRHTVSYVDYEDGSSQLQFCSDKCLNQYKMHIFCRETRAHLEMHPHLPTSDTSSGLITPDLWLRNCSSPGQSPPHINNEPQTSPLPLITVAHPSKLMATPTSSAPLATPTLPRARKKRLRKRSMLQIHKTQHNPDVPQDLRVVNQAQTPAQSRTTTFSAGVPNGHQGHQEVNGFFRSRNSNPEASTTGGIPHNLTMNMNIPGMNNLLMGPRLPPVSLPGPQMVPMGYPRSGVLPPVTVMVPYPVLIPVPLPIPIPLPLSAFIQAANLKENCKRNENEGEQNGHVEESGRSEDEEEIVVDDDTRGQQLGSNSSEEDIEDNQRLQLRKRKFADCNGTKTNNNTNSNSSSSNSHNKNNNNNNNNYKHNKKSLSV